MILPDCFYTGLLDSSFVLSVALRRRSREARTSTSGFRR